MNIIVHIGHGKTGSSSIQSTLLKNSLELVAQGFFYTGLNFEHMASKNFLWQRADGWNDLLYSPQDRVDVELVSIISQVIDEARAKDCHTIIWSNESLFGHHALVGNAIEHIRAQGHEFHVVGYIRRHDSWALSAYKQWGLKHKTYPGKIKTFDEWMATQNIRFAGALHLWASGNWVRFSVRNFDACNDVVEDFLGFCGIDFSSLEIIRENDSPSLVALGLWTIFNSQFDGEVLPKELNSFLMQYGLIGSSIEHVDMGALLPDSKALKAVLDERLGDINALNEYLKASGQPPLDITPNDGVLEPITESIILSALLKVVKDQNEQLKNLQQRLSQLEKSLLKE